MNADVRLHIDRIVLHGFETLDRARLDVALQTELSRLFAEKGAPDATASTHHARLSVPPLDASADATPEHLGTQLAQTIYHGLR